MSTRFPVVATTVVLMLSVGTPAFAQVADPPPVIDDVITPQFSITGGDANPSGGVYRRGGAAELQFQYVVQASDVDANGVGIRRPSTERERLDDGGHGKLP